MAVGAISHRKGRTGCGMHWIIRLLPGRQVTSGVTATGGGNIQAVVVVDVAGRTGHIRVAIGQRKTKCSVIKLSVRPLCDRVALRACRRGVRKARLNVIGHVSAIARRLVPVGDVTAIAVRRVQRVVIVDMARSAWRRCGRHVCTDQREAGHAVIERGRVPTLGGVAIRTICGRERRTGRRMHRIIRLLPGR